MWCHHVYNTTLFGVDMKASSLYVELHTGMVNGVIGNDSIFFLLKAVKFHPG